MRNFIKVFTLYYFLSLNDRVSAITENYVRKGEYPYMAFIYYPDETVSDQYKSRFFQNAILIKPDWLISASIEIGNQSFPTKTMLARLGAVAIDSNFTLNEDEDEQEREVIEVVLPTNHNITRAWSTDISLLNTLLPFKLTSFVKAKQLNLLSLHSDKMCKILAFTRKPNSGDKILNQLTVELLPQTTADCGQNFIEKTMICGVEDKEYRNITTQSEFCQDNAGGPLVCDDEIIGLQTYISEKSCKPPRLFQLLSGWNQFVLCGTVYNCHDDSCTGICKIVPKDTMNEDFSTVSSTTQNTTVVKDLTTERTENATTNSTESNLSTAIKEDRIVEPTSIVPMTELTSTLTVEKQQDTNVTTSEAMSTVQARRADSISPSAITTMVTSEIEDSNSNLITPTIDKEVTRTDIVREVKVEAQLQAEKVTRSAADRAYAVTHVLMCPIIMRVVL